MVVLAVVIEGPRFGGSAGPFKGRVPHMVGPAGFDEVSMKFVGCGRCGEWGHRRARCPYTPRGYLQREAFHD